VLQLPGALNCCVAPALFLAELRARAGVYLSSIVSNHAFPLLTSVVVAVR
jgi:hypothetical protein